MTQKLAFGADGADFAVETVLVSVEEGPVAVTMLCKSRTRKRLL